VMTDLLDDTNGLKFAWDAHELAEKAGMLLADDRLRLEMGERGRMSVQGLHPEKVLGAYARGYLELAGHEGGAGMRRHGETTEWAGRRS
jgi:hypothetical protein